MDVTSPKLLSLFRQIRSGAFINLKMCDTKNLPRKNSYRKNVVSNDILFMTVFQTTARHRVYKRLFNFLCLRKLIHVWMYWKMRHHPHQIIIIIIKECCYRQVLKNKQRLKKNINRLFAHLLIKKYIK